MITDLALEAQKTQNPRPYLNGSYTFTSGFNYLAAGTGSTQPSPTQTSLVAEVARTGSNGGFGENASAVFLQDQNRVILRAQLVRVISFSTSYNLAEFGFFHSSSGANCMYRQLFRENPADPNSNPVVVSVQNGDQLRVSYTVDWIVTLGFPLSRTLTINGSQVTMDVGLGVPESTAYRYGNIGDYLPLWHPNSSASDGVALVRYTRADSLKTLGAWNFPSGNVNAGDSAISITPTKTYGGTGVYRVTRSYTLSTSQMNGTLRNLVLTSSAITAYGSIFPAGACIGIVFTPAITKLDTQILTISITIEWGRL